MGLEHPSAVKKKSYSNPNQGVEIIANMSRLQRVYEVSRVFEVAGLLEQNRFHNFRYSILHSPSRPNTPALWKHS